LCEKDGLGVTGHTERVVEFVIPNLIPPSTNHYKVPAVRRDGRTGRTFKTFRLTPETIAFYAAVGIFARGRTVAPDDLGKRKKVRYLIRANVVLGKGKRGDADNFGKCICDGLQAARVIHSDAFVVDCQITVEKNDRQNPRTELHIERLEIN
jgi:Holliday junction resolvase RusA-like endonuclease